MGVTQILRNGPRNQAELDQLAAYADRRRIAMRIDWYGPLLDVVLVAAVVAAPIAVARIAVALWMCVGAFQAVQAAPAFTRDTFLAAPDKFAEVKAENVSPEAVVAKTTSGLAAFMVVFGLVMLALSFVSYPLFVFVVVGQAAWSVYAKVIGHFRVKAIDRTFDTMCADTPWAKAWRTNRQFREQAVDAFFASSARQSSPV
jgi:hypothetical protein